MIELASDPQSIPFLRGNRISLPLLKNEIDRRMLKITCLVKRLDRKKRRSAQPHRSHQHQYIQTEPADTHSQQKTLEDTAVLAEINQQDRMNRQHTSNLKSQAREERPPHSGKNKANNSKQLNQQPKSINASSQQPTIQEHPLIESNGFTFREIQPNHEGSTDRKNIQDSQDDKIFESLDFGLQISNVEMCNSVISEGDGINRYRTAAGRQIGREGLLVSSFTDLSGSEVGKAETSKRNRKIRMAGRERRIIITEECKQRMEQQVEQLYTRKRKEVCDYKLRINVLRKIEEKYGEEYSA